jgi:hypothetical protein
MNPISSDLRRDPTAGRTGSLFEVLADLSDDELDEYEQYNVARHDELVATGDHYDAWWVTKFISAARVERSRRAHG